MRVKFFQLFKIFFQFLTTLLDWFSCNLRNVCLVSFSTRSQPVHFPRGRYTPDARAAFPALPAHPAIHGTWPHAHHTNTEYPQPAVLLRSASVRSQKSPAGLRVLRTSANSCFYIFIRLTLMNAFERVFDLFFSFTRVINKFTHYFSSVFSPADLVIARHCAFRANAFTFRAHRALLRVGKLPAASLRLPAHLPGIFPHKPAQRAFFPVDHW